MNVRERQNNQWSMDRLVAQRLLYRHVKTVENWRLVSMLVVAVLLLWGLAAEGGHISQVATVIVVFLWFVDQVALVPLAGQMKKEAAIIQEDFDCFVLDIPWPEHGGVKRPTQDRVNELVRKGEKIATVRKGLEDWYGGDEIPAEALAARLHCQRFTLGVEISRMQILGGPILLTPIFLKPTLSGADLSGANISNTVLDSAKGLTQRQLNRACADADAPPSLNENRPRLVWRSRKCKR